jgi:hypothetical protein
MNAMQLKYRAVLIIFVVALVIRLAVLSMLPVLPNADKIDPDSYHSLARNLVAGNGFVAPNERGEMLPNVARTPVYPLFLATLIKLGGDRLRLFFAAQCVLGAATSALTVVLTARWLSLRAATVAGLAVALDPNCVVRCVDLMTETVFAFLLVVGACVIAWRTTHAWGWCFVGVIWSLAALCRPIAVWLWIVVVAMLLVPPLKMAWRMRATCLLAFLIGFLPPLGFWMLRNERLTGNWFIATIATHNLLLYRAGGVEAARTGTSLDEVQQRFHRQYGDMQFFDERMRFERRLRDYRQTSFTILRRAPVLAAKQAVVGWLMLLFGPGARSLPKVMHGSQRSVQWWPPVYGVVLVGVVIASVVGATRLGRAAVMLAALVLYFVLLAGGPEANSRFRTPVTPMLAVLAAAAIPQSRKP